MSVRPSINFPGFADHRVALPMSFSGLAVLGDMDISSVFANPTTKAEWLYYTTDSNYPNGAGLATVQAAVQAKPGERSRSGLWYQVFYYKIPTFRPVPGVPGYTANVMYWNPTGVPEAVYQINRLSDGYGATFPMTPDLTLGQILKTGQVVFSKGGFNRNIATQAIIAAALIATAAVGGALAAGAGGTAAAGGGAAATGGTAATGGGAAAAGGEALAPTTGYFGTGAAINPFTATGLESGGSLLTTGTEVATGVSTAAKVVAPTAPTAPAPTAPAPAAPAPTAPAPTAPPTSEYYGGTAPETPYAPPDNLTAPTAPPVTPAPSGGISLPPDWLQTGTQLLNQGTQIATPLLPLLTTPSAPASPSAPATSAATGSGGTLSSLAVPAGLLALLFAVGYINR
jgi:hypothetical protein